MLKAHHVHMTFGAVNTAIFLFLLFGPFVVQNKALKEKEILIKEQQILIQQNQDAADNAKSLAKTYRRVLNMWDSGKLCDRCPAK